MKTLALLTIMLGACTTEPGGSDVPGDLSGQFELATVRTMRGELPIAGVDSDGAGGLWIAYSLSGGDYYANDDVRVVHLDAAGTKDKEFRFKDEFADVHGIAFDGHAVWLNHSGGNEYARKIDATTGAVIGSFGTETGVTDLDAFDGELRMSVVWDQVVGLDAETGGQKWRAKEYLETGGAQRGIASMADRRVWVASLDDRIYLLDPKGHIVGAGRHHLLEYDSWTVDVGMYLGWDGHNVIVASDNQIAWLEPQ
jgi:DNA-binding beta-propeller fold protein YncE